MRHQVVLSLELARLVKPRHARVAVAVGHEDVAAVSQLDRPRRFAEVVAPRSGRAPRPELCEDGAVAAQLGRGVRPGVRDPHGAVAGGARHVRHPEQSRAALLQDLARVLVDPQQQRVVAGDRLGVVEVAPVRAGEGGGPPGAGAAAEDPRGAVARARDGRDLAHRSSGRRGSPRPLADARGALGPESGVLSGHAARQALLFGAREASRAVRVGRGHGPAAAGVEGSQLRPAHDVHVAPFVFFVFVFSRFVHSVSAWRRFWSRVGAVRKREKGEGAAAAGPGRR